MSATRIASRYAKSLLDMSIELNLLEEVLGDIEGFHDALSHRDLYLLIKSPIIKSDTKLKIFKKIFEGKVEELTLTFFNIVIRKGREAFFLDIAEQFIRQYRDLKGITLASLKTAIPVSAGTVDKIKKALKDSGWSHDKVEINATVDEDIIGGFIIQIDDRQYDASIKSKLAELKKGILDNSYIKSL